MLALVMLPLMFMPRPTVVTPQSLYGVVYLDLTNDVRSLALGTR